MKNFELSPIDIKFYLKKNKTYFIAFLLCFILGQIFGIVFVVTSDGYLNLVSSSNKLLVTFINGVSDFGEVFWSKLIGFLVPLILIFLLNLNFYLGLFSNLFIIYQSALLFLSNACIISIYGFGGVISTIFLSLPINLIYFCILAFFLTANQRRSYEANKIKKVDYGLTEPSFLISIGLCALMIVLLALILSFVYPLILKNVSFIIV